MKGTLTALGIHKRNQTVYHRHSSDIAGKILKGTSRHTASLIIWVSLLTDFLKVKELVEVENVRREDVRNKWEQRQERKAVRGYKVVGSKKDTFMHV